MIPVNMACIFAGNKEIEEGLVKYVFSQRAGSPDFGTVVRLGPLLIFDKKRLSVFA